MCINIVGGIPGGQMFFKKTCFHLQISIVGMHWDGNAPQKLFVIFIGSIPLCFGTRH